MGRGGVDIPDATVVVTGASSGIGRATAIALAQRGANVVLAARSHEDLDEVAAGCREVGGGVLAVPTDVARSDEVEELARRAVERFGGFDVWLNAAAVMAYGAVWEVPADAYRRIVETNLFGTLHGSRTALSHFRERGHGVLLNVDSVYGRITSPYVSPYVVSKFGVRGLTLCLRQETTRLPGIDVCAILPQAVDTPIFRHAANYTGSQVTALPAISEPQRVVRATLRCIERPRAEVVVGVTGRLLILGEAVLPRLYEWAAPRTMDLLAIRPEDASRSEGNVFAPEPDLNQVGGGWRAQRRNLRRVVGTLVAAGALAPLVAWRRRRSPERSTS